MRTRFPLGLVLALVASARLSAHDFWLAATEWSPSPGAPVTVTAGIGERFPTRTPFRPRGEWLGLWRVIGLSGELAMSEAFRAQDLTMATDVRLPAPGAYLGVAMVTPMVTEMDAQEFTEYLREEKLAQIIEARHAAGESGRRATEVYARYAKIAIRNGSGPALHLVQPLGLKAEFVPDTDPTSLRTGDSLTVQLLVDGRPVKNWTVSAVSGEARFEGRTDDTGRVTFAISRDGAWLVKTVHMVRRTPVGGGPGPEWESHWVTLAFHTVPFDVRPLGHNPSGS